MQEVVCILPSPYHIARDQVYAPFKARTKGATKNNPVAFPSTFTPVPCCAKRIAEANFHNTLRYFSLTNVGRND